MCKAGFQAEQVLAGCPVASASGGLPCGLIWSLPRTEGMSTESLFAVPALRHSV